MSLALVWERSFLSSGNSKCKGPEAGVCLDPGFSTSALLMFRAGYFCHGGCPVHCSMISRTPSIYPLDSSSSHARYNN